MVGLLPAGLAAATMVAKLFRDAALRVCCCKDPDGWLRRHAVMVGAVSGALWEHDCDSARLILSRSGVPDFLRAIREGYRALDAAHVTREALVLRAIFRYVPPPLASAYWRWYLGEPRGEMFFAAHARHASREMSAIAEEIAVVIRASGIQTPTFDRLRRSIPA